ncbi:hypothetical protein NMG60_11016317 [Bertholletia excelsa]
MHSIAPLAPVDIGPYWTDQQIIMALEKLKQGHSVGENVTADINPYQHEPSNLPVDIWYFTSSEQKKDSEHGFWKAKGDACKIFTNSSIDGWRKTLEFYNGQAPYGQRTNWLMQEYRVTQKGLRIGGNLKDMLCRVFQSTSEVISDQDLSLKLGGKIIAGSNRSLPKPSDSGSVNGQGCVRESQAMNNYESRGPLAAVGELPGSPVENISDIDYILRGDYMELDDLANAGSRLGSDDHANSDLILELDDLANPVSGSTSSYNTSCRTLTSDEVFDEWELLRDPEDEINKDARERNTNLKLSVAASARADEVVMMPATLESLISSSGSKSPTRAVVDNKLLDKRVPENVAKSQTIENGNEGASSSCHVATSSNVHKATRGGEENALTSRIKKLKKKFLCFMPF